MAKKNNSARKHSSPGLYFTDTVVNYATKSLGITSLGVIGETLRGRAFEPVSINDWAEFTYNFGGTSTEKFSGSQYPKYELPYIAQSYLEESHNLKVVRVLGLSGVNAGPAWVVTAKASDANSEYNDMVVLVLRSRAIHKKAALVSAADPEHGICENQYEYDGIEYFAKDVTLEASKTLNLGQSCNPGFNAENGTFDVDPLNYGTFTIKVELNDGSETPNYKYYSVTLNRNDKNYIYNVIGSEPSNGDAEIYVEELYDVALKQLVNEGKIESLNQTVVKYENVNIVPRYDEVYDLLTDSAPSRKTLGRRYLYSASESKDENRNAIKVRYYNSDSNVWGEPENGTNGVIYTVMTMEDKGKRIYFYGSYAESEYVYDEATPEEIANIPNNYEWIADDDASVSGKKRTVFPGQPDVVTINSPEYVKIGAACKVVSKDTADDMLAKWTACQNAVRLHEMVAVTTQTADTATKTDAVIIEYSTPDKPVLNKEFELKYDATQEGGETNIVTIYTGSAASQGDNPDWRIRVDLNAQDVNFSGVTGGYADPSKIIVEYGGNDYGKIYKKSRNSISFEEKLTVYDYSTDVVENKFSNCVRVASEDSFYVNTDGDVKPITLDFNNYKEQYRWAVSPWIVSEIKGSANNIELNKLFRFHAISDGTNSTTEFKVSIENIDPSTGRFDVVIRDFYDSDLSVNAYEKYLSCDLVPGSSNYIALKIGSTDGLYNSKSRYVTVEVIENDITKNSIPAGFIGYPIRDYSGFAITQNTNTATAPYFRYNTSIDEDVKAKKQYFGVSDLVGIDEDIFNYKGVEAYDGNPNGLTPCFHLDSRILNGKRDAAGSITEGEDCENTPSNCIKQTVSIDGVTGYSFVTVNRNNTTSEGIEPRITDYTSIIGTIYEDKAYRKFTVAMYGGWDGWDYYRTVRSNGDEYQYKEYKGAIDSVSGYGTNLNIYKNPESIGFESGEKVITSDYYAYLAGVKQLGNPKSITVNVLATPGIDYVNNKALVSDVIDIVEDDRGDLIYFPTTPDKPAGAGDSVEEMYTAEDAVYNLEDSDIDSNHCATYYPWVKCYDEDNHQYVFLPLTRYVVRSIAYTDNVKYSWYANAGWNRGNIPSTSTPRKKLTQPEQDVLYDGRINFVNSFAEEGNKIWGDKNLQIDDNLLNRISKRRLLLRIRKMLENSCIGMIFDPNDMTQSSTVRSAVNSVLDEVKKGHGISDYKVDIDDSAETRDQLGLNVTYHIKPIQALEWINFTSVLTPEGMQW